jgi:GT2 family glycosyltransferase
VSDGSDVPPFRVSIVIPVWNKVEYTQKCLETLVGTADPVIGFELIVVDNASTDATPQLLSSLEGDVHIIRNDINEGFGRACNAGAGLARAPYVLFLNNDIELLPGWLGPLLAAMDQDADLAGVQPRLLYPDGRLNSAGDLVFRDQAWNYGKGSTNPFGPQFSSRRAPDYASGACLLVRRWMFEAVGGFDDRYAPAYYEDADLSFAFRSKGWKVLYEPRSTVVHVEGGTAGTELDSEFKRRQMEQNKVKFWQKWAAELADRPLATLEGLDTWAHRDQGKYAPLPYD